MERRKIEQGREQHIGFAQESTLKASREKMKTHVGDYTRKLFPKDRASILPVFYKQRSTESEVSEISAWWCSDEDVGQNPGSEECGLRIPYVTFGGGSPAWNAFGRGDMASPWAKDPAGNIRLPHSPE